jgi:hypothetical protein
MSSSEVEWVKNILVPLLRGLGFKRIDFVHGTLEAGRDIVVADYDHFGLLRYCAIQAKNDGIRAQSATPEINTIIDQANTAFCTPYRDPLTATEHKIAGVYLVLNGSITDAAKNILFSRTGGWFTIVDISQLQLAAILSRAMSDEERRWLINLSIVELEGNQKLLKPFLESLERGEERRNIQLPFHQLKFRSIERYLEIAYQELHVDDVKELDTYIEACESFNFHIAKLPLGPANTSVNGAIETIQIAGRYCVDICFRIRSGLGELLKTERPAPGQHFEEPIFTQSSSI